MAGKLFLSIISTDIQATFVILPQHLIFIHWVYFMSYNFFRNTEFEEYILHKHISHKNIKLSNVQEKGLFCWVPLDCFNIFTLIFSSTSLWLHHTVGLTLMSKDLICAGKPEERKIQSWRTDGACSLSYDELLPPAVCFQWCNRKTIEPFSLKNNYLCKEFWIYS